MARRDETSPPDYYARLDVRPSASTDEIRAAYRKKARATHPDHNPDDPGASERFQAVKEAYQVLCDPERRAAYDRARAGRQPPEVLRIVQQAPAGCGGYTWRVFAGIAAVVVFFVLEALGVWAADTWVLVVAVGGTALLAGLVTVLVAQRFPDEATDMSLRLDADRLTMWADGRTILRLTWAQVQAVQLRADEDYLDVAVDVATTKGLRPVPPILTAIDRRRCYAVLRLNLSDTDMARDTLVTFLHHTGPVPFPAAPPDDVGVPDER